jgi:putative acetyltransferase
LKGWLDQIDGRIIFVAENNTEVAGFASFEPSGHIDHVYVHHRFQRQGVASALLQRIKQEANSRGVRRLFTEASITARPFFENAGFRVIASQNVTLRGTSLLNYRMEKVLD